MLLQHPWLAPLAKPETIMEEDEEESLSASTHSHNSVENGPLSAMSCSSIASEDQFKGVVDQEVADWVIDALDKKKKGLLGKGRKNVKPALHAAPLDAVSSPSRELKPAPSAEA
jgi:mitogen-activated protein kinase kinase